MMMFLLPLVLLSASSYAYVLTKYDFIQIFEVNEDVYTPDLMSESVSRDRCPADHATPKKCNVSGTTINCCSITNPFALEKQKVCLSCTYTKTDKSYKCVATAKNVTFFNKTLPAQGKGNINMACIKSDGKGVKASVCVFIECQKPSGSKLEGCARMQADFDIQSEGIKDHVDISYGCFAL